MQTDEIIIASALATTLALAVFFIKMEISKPLSKEWHEGHDAHARGACNDMNPYPASRLGSRVGSCRKQGLVMK